MQPNNTKTFQQIYDFCLLDATYNAYYNIPDHFECKSREQYRYYYNNLSHRGQCRAGTYIYSQSQRQLERFIKGQQQDFYIHIDDETFEIVDYRKYEGPTIYIVVHIAKDGVIIQYEHPYKSSCENNLIRFTPRSHRLFNKGGIVQEVKNHFYRHHLYPEGRYRDLQIEYRIPKDKFVNWYRHEYRRQQERKHDQEHRDMVNTCSPPEPEMSWDDCYGLLQASGAFFDFNADEYEREEMTDMFYNMCNK
ncbi:hypothetical protein IR083_07790 [Dysgonomonas sp. GY75]|nr:hypothetical protein [Dysgonomonas sp. GY75]